MKMMMVVQARFSSRRLPGKVLRPMAGKPMLAWLIERLERVHGTDGIVVATSTSVDDDAVAQFAAGLGISCFRGPLDDVLGRFVGTVRQFRLDAAVRISGDSPLLDPVLVGRGIRLFGEERPDLVTNVWPRTYPKGQSVEIVSREALERADAGAGGEDREHVTAPIYRYHEHYRIASFGAETSSADVQMSVDTETDFRLAERMLEAMSRPHWEYGVDELLELRKAVMPQGTAT
jgi:spore coat polysaccharide biosynthesis protein SpsF